MTEQQLLDRLDITVKVILGLFYTSLTIYLFIDVLTR